MLWREILENISLLETLPQLSSEKFIPLWSDDVWDGPIAGICIYENTLFYFIVPFNYDLDDYPRMPTPHCLIYLANEDIKLLFDSREEFERYVSSNYRYILRATRVERNKDTHSQFYDNRKDFDFRDKEVFGVLYMNKWTWKDTYRWNKEVSDQN